MPTLEQKIRKHNPSLQELTFGCQIKVDGNHGHYILGRAGSGMFFTSGIRKVVSQGFYYPAEFERHCEIIGHPIELRHILMAIEKSGKYVSVDNTGEIYVCKDSPCNGVKVDLSIPFSQWSPEVHEFINKLID